MVEVNEAFEKVHYEMRLSQCVWGRAGAVISSKFTHIQTAACEDEWLERRRGLLED